MSRPPLGYRWLCYDRGDCLLIAIATGVIREVRYRDERERQWRYRYARTYAYDDDLYYRECRDRPDPGGVLIGGLIGGLIGRSAGDDRPSATLTGIIIGAAVGAALTRDLDCGDRGYAYRAYYGALNAGRPGVWYRWRNPYNRHYGEFRVLNYYYDTGGFSCARYAHTAFLDRRRFATGNACRQPDGAWIFLN